MSVARSHIATTERATSYRTAVGTVAVRERGTRPTVLLSHGGQAGADDRSVDAALDGQGVRLVVPSRPARVGALPLDRGSAAQRDLREFIGRYHDGLA